MSLRVHAPKTVRIILKYRIPYTLSLRFRVWGLGFGVWGLGFGVLCLGVGV